MFTKWNGTEHKVRAIWEQDRSLQMEIENVHELRINANFKTMNNEGGICVCSAGTS
jgi:hypothetical protein